MVHPSVMYGIYISLLLEARYYSGKIIVLQHFRQTTGYSGELYTDPERDIYSKLGLLKYTKKPKLKGIQSYHYDN